MKSKIFVLSRYLIFCLAALPYNAFAEVTNTKPTFSNGALSYVIGGFIAVLLMIYLVYTLLKPEKF